MISNGVNTFCRTKRSFSTRQHGIRTRDLIPPMLENLARHGWTEWRQQHVNYCDREHSSCSAPPKWSGSSARSPVWFGTSWTDLWSGRGGQNWSYLVLQLLVVCSWSHTWKIVYVVTVRGLSWERSDTWKTSRPQQSSLAMTLNNKKCVWKGGMIMLHYSSTSKGKSTIKYKSSSSSSSYCSYFPSCHWKQQQLSSCWSKLSSSSFLVVLVGLLYLLLPMSHAQLNFSYCSQFPLLVCLHSKFGRFFTLHWRLAGATFDTWNDAHGCYVTGWRLDGHMLFVGWNGEQNGD